MKKQALIMAGVCFALNGSSQIFKGWGIFGSLTSSRHVYRNADTEKKDTTFVFEHYYPQTHISKERLSWGAGIFAELGRERLRWQTELEYINKGAKEMPFGPPGFQYTGDRTGDFTPNKLTYIQWNNYLKFYYPIFGEAHWYIMPGVRLEYLFRNSSPVFPEIAQSFPKFWFSGDVGLGYEFPLVRKIHLFTEYHWNPDIIAHEHGNTKVRARTHELRIGIAFRPKKRRIDDCNAPVYKGPAY